jgi:hypothetical protein
MCRRLIFASRSATRAAIALLRPRSCCLRLRLEAATVVRSESWVAGGVALLQIILLHTIVWRGDRTIESQHASWPLRKVLEPAVRQHRPRTGSRVSSAVGMLPPNTSSLHQLCIYRFAQEGLNNAYRHAAAAGQDAHVVSDGRELTVEVADKGPGIVSFE